VSAAGSENKTTTVSLGSDASTHDLNNEYFLKKKIYTKKFQKKKNQCKDERKLKTTTKESETQQKSNFGSQFQCSRAKDFRRRYESDSVGEWRNCVN